MRAHILLAILAAGTVPVGVALADTKAGVDAWERGDYVRAVAEWRTAANAGDADAAFNLGQAYKLGRGVPVDTQQAESWYRQAAAKGHVQAEDNYGLALFQNGRPRDAIPYLEKSVARGEPRAQYILGTMLFNGTDIKRDWVRAYALTARASQSGLPQATQGLAQMDAYVNANDRKAGLALATRLTGAGDAPDVAGRGDTPALRGVDLPPSFVGQRPGEAPPVVVQVPAPIGRDGRPTYVAPPAPPPAPARAAAPAGRWRLQLGAFGDPANARKLGGQVAGRFAGRTVAYVKAGALTRVLVGPFASRAEAQAACGSLSPCVPTAN